MELNFICPVCFQEIQADTDMSGDEANCPTCEAEITVPQPDEPSTARLGGYRLEHCLGKGRMGMVYLATQMSMSRKVALRILTPDLTQDDEYVQRFIEETRLNARIEHPHVVSFYDVGEEQDRVYAAMSYVEGKSVQERLDEDGPLEEAETLGIGLTIAQTLKYVHEQYDVLAQNLNPSNIFIDRHGEVKLMNLGVTRYQGDSPDPDASLTATSVIYMSPEQTAGDDLDVRSDIFSLGVSLYQLLTGELPFTDEHQNVSPKAKRPELADGIDQLVQCMLNKEIDQRYQEWSGVIRDMERLQEGQQPLRQPDGSVLDASAVAAPATDDSAERQAPSLRLKRDREEEEAKPATPAPPAGVAPPAPGTDVEHPADDDDEPMVAEAIPDDEEDEVPTGVESGAAPPDVPSDKDLKKKKKAGPKKMAIRLLVLVLVLWGGFKFGFGPLVSAWRKAESAVYVVNASETDYKLVLGWRRLKQDLRASGVAQFKLFVGMTENQGLKAVPIEGGKSHKVKVPITPGEQTLVNLMGARTYYVYDTTAIADGGLTRVEKLADQVIRFSEPTSTYPLLQEAKGLGEKAYQSSTDAEVIQLDQYQPRMMMVGVVRQPTTDEDTEQEVLPVITDQPVSLPVKNGQITYDAGNPETYSVSFSLGKAGQTKVAGTTLDLPANLRLTASARGEQYDLRTSVNSQEFQHQGVTYTGNWTYIATKRPQTPQWTWEWRYSGQASTSSSILRITVRQPSKGNAEIQTTEQKR